MTIRKTEAIVLRSRDFSESSLVISFYTRDLGKINGLAKGIKSRRKKYGGYLQPFTYNDIVFYQKVHAGLYTVSQCNLRDFFPAIREDLEKTAYASYFVELIDKATPVQDENIEIFNLLLRSLSLLSTEDAKKICRIFEIKLLDLLGLMPTITNCIHCGSIIRGKARFSASLGGTLCQRCFYKDYKSTPILKGAIATIKYISKQGYNQISRLRLTSAVEENLREVLNLFLGFHLESQLKTLEFLEKMNGNFLTSSRRFV